MAAELVVVGISYKTAAIDVREKLAFAEDAQPGAVVALTELPSLGEAMLISTCNRVEIFAATRAEGAGTAEAAAADVRRWLAEQKGLSITTLETHLYARTGTAAIKHVFRVASSLDSLVVGESQILGQLKEAYGIASQAGGVGPMLGRCLERAFGVAKRVRTETSIAKGSANVSSVAVELARSIFGDLKGRQVLVIGAGKMADLAARHLADDGADEIMVINRSFARAQTLADKIDGVARPYEELEHLLGLCDIVVSSTGSPVPIISKDLIKRVMKARKNRPIFLIDIAVPRDVEAAVGKQDGVYLFDVDDLEKVVQENLGARRGEAEAAERIVEAETTQFLAWLRQQGVVPTIKDLRERFLAVARAEAEKTLAGLTQPGQDLSEKQQKQVRQMAEAIVNKLLHTPLMALKTQDGAEAEALVAATRRLFALPEPEPVIPPIEAIAGEADPMKRSGG